MKIRLVLVVLAMVGLAAARPPMQNIFVPELMFSGYIEKCLNKTLFQKTSAEMITKETHSCFMACIFEETGIIKADGTVTPVYNDLETMEIIDDCKAKAEGDNCKLAWCLQHGNLFDLVTDRRYKS